MKITDRIHEEALSASTRYKQAEAELIEILQQVEQHHVYVKKGCPSLFRYVVNELGLSESVAYNLIAVARKAREIPELKMEIRRGAITLSNARKIAPVLKTENKAEWLAKARELSQRQLEKEIVRVRPERVTPERATYVTPTRVNLSVGLSENDMLRLRRVQDLLSQARRRSVNLEEVLVEMTGDYLRRNDPLEKAKRQQVKKGLIAANEIKAPVQDNKQSKTVKPVSLQVKPGAIRVRKPIPAAVSHQVTLRDGRRCVFVNERGERCQQTRWIEIHHKIPVSKGGEDTIENLETLCSGHHKLRHYDE